MGVIFYVKSNVNPFYNRVFFCMTKISKIEFLNKI
ncbi:hypothetical protein Clo1100_1521 [Clostridium sp. BNL1100]|nr:hypothetical protein Clo1100_1521 [Clostridium sp. BNL1100]